MYIESIGVATPGMLNWQQASDVFSNKAEFVQGDFPRYKPSLLPANERRRATDMIRLAFNVCEQATEKFSEERDQLASIFASSGGDYQVIDQICRALTQPERFVSPTQFHNSVHNSAAGYWGIAAKSHKASSSISAYDYSFSAGLLEASLQLPEEGRILFACYDAVPPSPLQEKRKIPHPFAFALVLNAEETESTIAKLDIKLTSDKDGIRKPESLAANSNLESLRLSNPAARGLPLLESLSRLSGDSTAEELVFHAVGGQSLLVTVSV